MNGGCREVYKERGRERVGDEKIIIMCEIER